MTTTLHYDRHHDRPVIVDTDGGVWAPDDPTTTEIDAAADPAGTAIEICKTNPMRGTWID